MLTTRPVDTPDIPALAAILNEIVARGGTTARQQPMTPEAFGTHYVNGPAAICCTLVENGSEPVGFQGLAHHPDLAEGWADIGTYTRRDRPVPGAGRALFAATLAEARARGLTFLNATIRADNTGGLAFYRKLGFQLYATSPSVPLDDGTPVDRLHHRLAI